MIRFVSARNLLLILVAIALSGCAAASLREAQDQFNTGAEIEARALNASLLSDNVDAGPAASIAALNEYRLAYTTATKAIAENSAELRQDKLLGATYVLKAMALWRISDLQGDPLQEAEKPYTEVLGVPFAGNDDSSPASIDNARQQLLTVLNEIQNLHGQGNIYLGTRDKVLLRALYGFYDHDGGRAASNYVDAKPWLESAIKQLDIAVSKDVPAQHPVRVYVGSAQLRTLAVWNVFIRTEFQACKSDESRDNPNCKKTQKERQEKINRQTKTIVCDLEPFWVNNATIKKQLDALTATTGLLSAGDNCNN
jgi:hypothetical protein